MGVEYNPERDSCKCGKCPLGGNDFTLKEERGNDLIEKELEWMLIIASYPWIRDPGSLPDNYIVIVKMFFSLEKRIMKNIEYTKMYND